MLRHKRIRPILDLFTFYEESLKASLLAYVPLMFYSLHNAFPSSVHLPQVGKPSFDNWDCRKRLQHTVSDACDFGRWLWAGKHARREAGEGAEAQRQGAMWPRDLGARVCLCHQVDLDLSSSAASYSSIRSVLCISAPQINRR